MRIASLAAAALVSTVLLGCRLSVPFSERLFFERSEAVTPRAADCERCHLEVYQEWSESLHAHAWTSDAFQKASAEGRAAECRGCHVPGPLAEAGPVAPREHHLGEGVTCVSCHLSTQPGARPLTMRGPVSRSSPVEVHPIFDEDPFYRSSELCGRCHEGALEEWRASPAPADGEAKPTCQQCHMPEVERRVESVHPEHPYSVMFVALERKETLRRHAFAVPEDADRHLSLEIAFLQAGPEPVMGLIVRNDLPHGLPTGRFGRREIRLVAEWPGGESVQSRVRSLGEAIPAGARIEMVLPLPQDFETNGLEVRLERWEHRTGSWTPLARAPSS